MNFENENSNAVEIVDKIINKAISMGSSDIHLESTENFLRIRFRLDGMLYDQDSISCALMPTIISRIKILSNIDIAQRRIPQDGKFKIKLTENNVIDLRVSTFPSIYGEKIVIRILDRLKTTITLQNLGFQQNVLDVFRKLIKKATGFILVTGPTGSGKTTTLYAALSELHTPEKNIITLEDPVEYHINGVTQGQINLGSGFNFAKGIRSLLRQDPDIAMIGEIRDKESAKIAIEAALTGHLVFSTLHTNDAASTIMRLMDMEIEPFLINASLSGVLAQRLVRKICKSCIDEFKPTTDEKKIISELKLDLNILFKGVGCKECNNLGYKGRTGIFELLITNNNLRSLIVKHPNFDEIYNHAVKDGMTTLIQDAAFKIKNGVTTLDELARVIL